MDLLEDIKAFTSSWQRETCSIKKTFQRRKRAWNIITKMKNDTLKNSLHKLQVDTK